MEHLGRLKNQLEERLADLGALTDDVRALLEEAAHGWGNLGEERDALERTLSDNLRELHRAHSEKRAILNAFPALFLWAEPTGTIVDYQSSPAAADLFEREEVVGRRLTELDFGEADPLFREGFHEARLKGELVHFEYLLENEAGAARFIEVRLLPLPREHVLVILRDITERKRAEEALAAEKEQLSVTLRSIGDGVITASSRGKVLMMNRVAETLTGWRQEEAIDQPLEEVFHVVDRQTPEGGVSRDTGTLNMTGYLIGRDGTERAISNSMSPMRARDGRIVGVVIVFRDITEERRRDEERLRASKLESVGILAGGIAHDFNNFLTAIMGNLALARLQLPEGHKITDLLHRSESASRQARDLTQQLLTLARGGTPVKKTAAARELIEECASFALRGSNVRCDLEIDEDIHLVEVDKGQITQVIHNLIINADQAMPEGGVIEIRGSNVRVEQFDTRPLKPGDYVVISVKDRGIGIPSHHLDKIFDPYFTTKKKGSGLGLATSYSIAQNHQGWISVDSELGVGTTFSVYLPAAPRDARLEEPGELGRFLLGGGRVLVMDDDEAVRGVTEGMLKHLGYQVTVAEEGSEMVELYRRAKQSGKSFDVVIMDLTIPGGMGGGEAISKVLEINHEARVIVASGYSNDPIMGNFASHGFGAVLKKPFDLNELCRALEEVRGERPKGDEGGTSDAAQAQ